MTQEEIITGNKFIAEFMYPNAKQEYESGEIDIEDGVFRKGMLIFEHFDQMRYHLSWDWLMPVYSKAIQETENDGGDEHFDLQNYFEDAAMNNRIDLAFSAVVEFIKWYNL